MIQLRPPALYRSETLATGAKQLEVLQPVLDLMRPSGFDKFLGDGHFLELDLVTSSCGIPDTADLRADGHLPGTKTGFVILIFPDHVAQAASDKHEALVVTVPYDSCVLEVLLNEL